MARSTDAENASAGRLVVNRSTSLVGRSVMPCSRMAPEPARAKSSASMTPRINWVAVRRCSSGLDIVGASEFREPCLPQGSAALRQPQITPCAQENATIQEMFLLSCASLPDEGAVGLLHTIPG